MSYHAGWSREVIPLEPRGYGLHGYGTWENRAWSTRSPLHARAVHLRDAHGRALDFCCLDLGYVTHVMRAGVVERLRTALGPAFHEEGLVLTCTHTHSGPGGCTQDALYNVGTPGYLPEVVEQIVGAATRALLTARESAQPTTVRLAKGAFADEVPVAWNRSLRAYNANPEVTPVAETARHLALDRAMQVLGFYRGERLEALLSLFGVHATCVGNTQRSFDGDNKGYAASHAEAALERSGVSAPVAIFAQATAGDVSPHFHGPGEQARRRAIRGDAEYAYARRNGELQGQHALDVLAGPSTLISGPLDAVLTYADFSAQEVEPRFAGETGARTSEPCHGTAFFVGTPVDGPALPKPLGLLANLVATALRRYRLSALNDPASRAHYEALYRSQGPKHILLEAGAKRLLGRDLAHVPLPDAADPMIAELKRQARRGAIRHSALVPSVLPLQVLRLGNVALVCCPGEFTTIAGRRVVEVVHQHLRAQGADQTLLCTYCNDYMGYVTTAQEYRVQAYEGGHTVFGQWTLAAFQTRFDALARQLAKPPSERQHDRHTRPPPCLEDELALRTNLPVPG